MIDIQTISLVIACASVVVGVASVVDKNRREIKTREANLFMQISQRQTDPKFYKDWIEVMFTEKWRTWEEYEARYGLGEHAEDEGKVQALIAWYDMLGTLVREKLIDPRRIYKTYAVITIMVWEKVKPVIKALREIQDSSLSDSFEWLANLFKKMREEERKGEPTKTIEKFVEDRKKLLKKESAGV